MWIITLLVSAIAFCWPFFAVAEDWQPATVYSYLFAAWGGVIALIILIAAFSGPAGRDRDRTADN